MKGPRPSPKMMRAEQGFDTKISSQYIYKWLELIYAVGLCLLHLWMAIGDMMKNNAPSEGL